MKVAVETLAGVSVNQDVPVDESLLVSARFTLDRAMLEVGFDARTEIANRLKGIYIIVDPEATWGRPLTEVAAQSLAGGARVVQLRDKLSDKGPMLELARELKALCDAHDALFVMNDHADLAHAVDAGVLHVGQTDLPVRDARQILSPYQLIGNSNGTMEEALQSKQDSVDYIAVGAIYSTTTMGKSGRNALGPEMLSRVKNAVKQPIVAIGGINRSNIQDVVREGADSVCVVSAVTFADDPKAATEELVHLYESAAR
jgi:thiamine-phosphate pyrophosphorylase